LFHVDSFEAGQLFEDAVSGLFEAFGGLKEASHEAPFSFFWFEAPLYEQELNVISVESEDDTIYGHQHTGFPRITIHASVI
jgi:hypothetical protein